jgi:hypothetical protein
MKRENTFWEIRFENTFWEIRAVCQCCSWKSSWFPETESDPTVLALGHVDRTGHPVVYGGVTSDGKPESAVAGKSNARGVRIPIRGKVKPIYANRAVYRRKLKK